MGNEMSKPEQDGLHCSHRGAGGILLADAPRNHRCGSHAKSHGCSKDQREEAFREPHCGNGIWSQAGHPENIHDAEQRLHRHFKDGWN